MLNSSEINSRILTETNSNKRIKRKNNNEQVENIKYMPFIVVCDYEFQKNYSFSRYHGYIDRK